MSPGRTPKPTALKKLQGNPGKRKLNAREPKVSGKKPRCPSHLSTEAKREWRRIVDELHRIGVLDVIDKAALAHYCQSWGRWVQTELELAGEPLVVESDKGNLYQNPLYSAARQAAKDMLEAAREFGMTPASRTRIKVDRGEEEPSLADQLFNILNG